MAVDFNSKEFNELSLNEKRDIVRQEFAKCAEDFEYYAKNYAYIRHPNAGIIPFKPFDFQLDVVVPISKVLLHRRTRESLKELENYKFKFDYEKWLNQLSEQMLDLIPQKVHQFYKITIHSPEYNKRVDTIILKSRQTGLSTIFQQLITWHINFHPSVGDLVLSKKDRDAKKFLKDIKVEWGLVPNPLRARRLAKNEHELWVSITGLDEHQSGVQVLPPTEDAGRSFSPNLIVLDEFAEYKRAEKIWASISMSVSAGGILVIIATPKGVGNLYHQMWEATNKSLTVITDGLKKEDNSKQSLSVFRPVVVHWSQLPQEEFKRRGFESGVEWYYHMRGKLAIEGGEKLVAQELDLDFNASGDTINYNIIKKLEKNALESRVTPKILTKGMPGLVIYEKPNKDTQYLIGVDSAEGVGADSDSFHVLALPKDGLALPRVVAYFNNNKISIKQFKEIVRKTGLLYNTAWLNIEKNNHGHVLLTYFIEDGDYDENKILNTYSVTSNDFVRNSKGWLEQKATRTLLIQTLLDFINDYQDSLSLPNNTVQEFKTFVNNKGRWEAQPGYHDDDIISLALSIIGWRLLPKYKDFLNNMGQAQVGTDIDYTEITSSSFIASGEDKTKILTDKKEKKYFNKHELDEIRDLIEEKKLERELKKDTHYQYKPLSHVEEVDDYDFFDDAF